MCCLEVNIIPNPRFHIDPLFVPFTISEWGINISACVPPQELRWFRPLPAFQGTTAPRAPGWCTPTPAPRGRTVLTRTTAVRTTVRRVWPAGTVTGLGWTRPLASVSRATTAPEGPLHPHPLTIWLVQLCLYRLIRVEPP